MRFLQGVSRGSWRRVVWLLGLLGVLVVAGLNARTQRDAPSQDLAATITWQELPPQGQAVLGQIRQGGPFRYDKDGTVFGNRERLLPRAQRGFYREYTVPTPGVSHRGARRIVCGGEVPTRPEACYFSEDHYASFRLIVR